MSEFRNKLEKHGGKNWMDQYQHYVSLAGDMEANTVKCSWNKVLTTRWPSRSLGSSLSRIVDLNQIIKELMEEVGIQAMRTASPIFIISSNNHFYDEVIVGGDVLLMTFTSRPFSSPP